MDGKSNLAIDNARPVKEIFGPGRKVAVFGIPAPFTGVCTKAHYPPYKSLADEFKSSGDVDELICYTVADPYSHYNWSTSLGNDPDKITFLTDPECEWAKEVDLDRNYRDSSLGIRAERFSMVVEDGIVKSFNVVEDASRDAELLLQQATEGESSELEQA